MLAQPARSIAALALVVILSILGSSVLAQSPNNATPAPTPDWQFRFDLFQMLLEQNGLEPFDPNSPRAVSLTETVVVSLGRQDNNTVLRRLSMVIKSGRALVAADQPVHFDGLFEIAAGPVRSLSKQLWYQDFNDCLVLDVNEQDPLLLDVGQLIVNRGGYLSQLSAARGNWRTAVAYPGRVRPNEAAGQPLLASLQPYGADQPTLFVLADHSLLSNGMIWHGDNAMLAINLSRLLTAGGMKRMVFLVDGKPLPSYVETLDANQPAPTAPEDIPLPELPPEAIPEPTLEQLLKVANTVVSKVEDSNLINEAIADQPRRILDSYYRRLLLIVAVVLLLTYAIYQLSKPAGRPLISGGGMSLPASAAKQTEGEDFATAEERGLAAKFLAKAWLNETTGSSEPKIWRKCLAEKFPDREKLDSALRIAQIAESNGPMLLDKADLAELGKTLDRLS